MSKGRVGGWGGGEGGLAAANLKAIALVVIDDPLFLAHCFR